MVSNGDGNEDEVRIHGYRCRGIDPSTTLRF